MRKSNSKVRKTKPVAVKKVTAKVNGEGPIINAESKALMDEIRTLRENKSPESAIKIAENVHKLHTQFRWKIKEDIAEYPKQVQELYKKEQLSRIMINYPKVKALIRNGSVKHSRVVFLFSRTKNKSKFMTVLNEEVKQRMEQPESLNLPLANLDKVMSRVYASKNKKMSKTDSKNLYNELSTMIQSTSKNLGTIKKVVKNILAA